MKGMKLALRTDASLQIGTGHVMRCLTLADALTAKGAQCEFICREHPGHLMEYIRGKGYAVHSLPTGSDVDADLTHSPWLGATQAQDAQDCALILDTLRPDWLVVDHYALDARWESAMASHCGQVMVIDDLADRAHACRVLLDQTFGREATNYVHLVPANCRVHCGSQYALLRPEFAALRSYSLQRRTKPVLPELLVTMGGVDKDNASGRVLQALRNCSLHADCRITVVMGATAPWVDEVRTMAHDMPWPTRVLVGVNNMAQLIADSDLAIGAAGATSWERCCLGLPTVMLVLAENQLKVAQGLQEAGAAALVSSESSTEYQLKALVNTLASSPERLRAMSRSAAGIVDGMGTRLVTTLLES